MNRSIKQLDAWYCIENVLNVCLWVFSGFSKLPTDFSCSSARLWSPSDPCEPPSSRCSPADLRKARQSRERREQHDADHETDARAGEQQVGFVRFFIFLFFGEGEAWQFPTISESKVPQKIWKHFTELNVILWLRSDTEERDLYSSDSILLTFYFYAMELQNCWCVAFHFEGCVNVFRSEDLDNLRTSLGENKSIQLALIS